MKFKKIAYSAAMSISLLSSVSYAALYETSSTMFEELNKPLHKIELENKKNIILKYQSIFNDIENKKFKRARTSLNTALKSTADDAALYSLLGMLETAENNLVVAKRNYRKAIEIDNTHIISYLALANIARREHNYNKVKEYYNKVLSIDAKNIGAGIALAQFYYKNNNAQAAIQLLSEGLRAVRGNIDAELKLLTVLGKVYVLEKKINELLRLSHDLIKRYPDNSAALGLLAGAQLLNNDKQKAEKTLRKILVIDPNNISQHLMLMKLLSLQSGHHTEIISLIDKVIAINPKDTHYLVLKADYLMRTQHFSDALQVAKLALEQFPNKELGKHLMGDVYRAQKQFDKALIAYQGAYEIENSDNTLIIISQVLVEQHKIDKAISLLNSELLKKPNSGLIRLRLAMLYLRDKKISQAKKQFELILNTEPNNVIVLNNLAWIYLQEGNIKALSLGKKAYKLAPQSVDIVDTYSSVLLAMGDKKRALVLLESINHIEKKPTVQFHLAQAYQKNNQLSMAIKTLESVVTSTQNFSEKVAAKKLLASLK